VLPIDLEVGRINEACAGGPGNHFLCFSFADLEIVIQEPSRIDWHRLSALADVLNGEIREFDFLARPIFTFVPYEAFSSDAACPQLTGPAKANAQPTRRMRVELFLTFQEVSELLGNDGSDWSIATQGNLSSSQIALCGANGAGSSSDAIVTSIVSESSVSSINKCVPQQAANERIRFACAILRGSPFVTTKSSRGTAPQVT
jgi:hypothetical protein